MLMLILGLVLFLGPHSLRIVADGWRNARVAALGEKRWKIVFSLVSIAGFVVLVWGFGQARQDPVVLYTTPLWLHHLNALFTLVAFVLFFAAHGPANHFKAALGHPMYAGIKVWAFGHLLATGMLHDVVLFGAFLLWAIAGFAAGRRRDRRAGVVYPAGTRRGDIVPVVVGIAVWALFAFWLHAKWIGVAPMG
jgi:uncharacterized membrane protein